MSEKNPNLAKVLLKVERALIDARDVFQTASLETMLDGQQSTLATEVAPVLLELINELEKLEDKTFKATTLLELRDILADISRVQKELTHITSTPPYDCCFAC